MIDKYHLGQRGSENDVSLTFSYSLSSVLGKKLHFFLFLSSFVSGISDTLHILKNICSDSYVCVVVIPTPFDLTGSSSFPPSSLSGSGDCYLSSIATVCEETVE